MIIKVTCGEGRPSASIPARVPRTCPCEIPPRDAAEREQGFTSTAKDDFIPLASAARAQKQPEHHKVQPKPNFSLPKEEEEEAVRAAGPWQGLSPHHPGWCGSRGGALRCRAGW